MTDVTIISVVGDERKVQKLKEVGISNAEALAEQAADPRTRQEIAAQTGIPGSLIKLWFKHIEFRRVKGVGEEYANFLETLGVRTLCDLARRNPTRLYRRMIKANRNEVLIRRLPALSQVEDWIAQAKRLCP